jgi:hypothetical protein
VAVAQFESVAQQRVARSMEAAAVCHPQAAAEPAAQEPAQRLAEPGASVVQAVALLPEEPEALDAGAVLRQAEHAAEAPKAAQPVAAAEQVEAPGAAEEPQREVAERVEGVVPRLGVVARGVAAEVARRQAARDAVVALQREVRDARAAARPSAAPWVSHQAQAPPWPAPSPAVQFALAMQRQQTALP